MQHMEDLASWRQVNNLHLNKGGGSGLHQDTAAVLNTSNHQWDGSEGGSETVGNTLVFTSPRNWQRHMGEQSKKEWPCLYQTGKFQVKGNSTLVL